MRHCNRPFETIEEHDETLLKNINDRVGRLDQLYILGDFARRDPDKWRDRINCKYVHAILGNHCKGQKFRKFQSVKDYHFGKFQLSDRTMQKIALFHYPMITWDCKHHGSWSLFGHIHTKPLPYDPGLAYHVGVDVNDFAPISLYDLEEIMKDKLNAITINTK